MKKTFEDYLEMVQVYNEGIFSLSDKEKERIYQEILDTIVKDLLNAKVEHGDIRDYETLEVIENVKYIKTKSHLDRSFFTRLLKGGQIARFLQIEEDRLVKDIKSRLHGQLPIDLDNLVYIGPGDPFDINVAIVIGKRPGLAMRLSGDENKKLKEGVVSARMIEAMLG